MDEPSLASIQLGGLLLTETQRAAVDEHAAALADYDNDPCAWALAYPEMVGAICEAKADQVRAAAGLTVDRGC